MTQTSSPGVAVTLPPPWQWPALSPGTTAPQLIAQLNAKLQALGPVVRDLSSGVVEATTAAQAGGTDPVVRGYFDTTGRLVTGLTSGATVGGVPALTVAAASAIDFREAFDALPDGWIVRVGSGTLQRVATGVTGGGALRCTGMVWRTFPYPLPFSPTKLYRITVRVRQVTVPSGQQPFLWAGLAAYDAQGRHLAPSGAPTTDYDSADNYVWAATRLTGLTPSATSDPGWVEFVGWVQGRGVAANGPMPSPRAPGVLPPNTVAYAPSFIVNQSGFGLSGLCVGEIDAFEVAEFDPDAAARLYAGLDTSGRVQTGVNANADIAGTFAGVLASVVDANGDIKSTAITPGFITTPMLAANSVNASHIQSISLATLQAVVGQLSALSADIGYVRAGMLESSDGTFGVRLTSSVPRPAGWTSWIDPFATGTDFTFRFPAFGQRANGQGYLDPALIPGAPYTGPDVPAARAEFSGSASQITWFLKGVDTSSVTKLVLNYTSYRNGTQVNGGSVTFLGSGGTYPTSYSQPSGGANGHGLTPNTGGSASGMIVYTIDLYRASDGSTRSSGQFSTPAIAVT